MAVKSTAVLEEATEILRQARSLVPEGKDAPESAEDRQRFNDLFAAGQAKLGEYRDLSATEGNVRTVRETLSAVLGGTMGADAPGFHVIARGDRALGRAPQTYGDSFIHSQAYQDLVASGILGDDGRGRRRVEMDPHRIGAATTDVLNTGSGQPGAALVTPQYLPDVIPLDQRPLTIDALFSHETTTSDTLSYARQTSFDNGAAAVAQATSLSTGLKPQSSIGWQRVTTPIENVATWMAATRRQLADVGQTRALIDNNLRLMLDLTKEDQELNGNGTSPNIRGLLNTSGVQLLDVSAVATAHANIDGIRDAVRLIATGPAFANADGVALNPIDAAYLDEAKDTTGRYLGGGPFGSGPQTIWRRPIVESLAIPAGFALVGAFKRGATVFQREEVAIYASDSHSDFFIRNLIAVLAEERFGLAVFFPSAFVYVTLKAAGW